MSENEYDDNGFFGVPLPIVKKIVYYYVTHESCQTIHSCESNFNEMLEYYKNKNIIAEWGVVDNTQFVSDLRKIFKWKNNPLILELFIKELQRNSLITTKKINGKLFIQWNESHTFLIAVFNRFFENDNQYTRYSSIQQLQTVCKKYFLNSECKPYNHGSLKTVIKDKTIPKQHREYAKQLFKKIDPQI